jgi:hypothetical protein
MVVYLYATNNIKAELYNASGTLLATATAIDSTYTGNLYKTAGLQFAYTNTITAAVKGIYIRKYVSPEPTGGAWGNTENAGTNVYLTTTSGDGGNVSTPGEGTYTYQQSQIVNISASADSCYHFVNWTGDAFTITNPNASSTTINMSTSNKYIVANFAMITYTLSLTANNSGGSPYFDGTSPFNCGASASIHANTNTSGGYTFSGWTPTAGIANASAANTTVTMSQARTLTASYIAPNGSTYTLSLAASPSAGGSPYFDGTSPFSAGTNASIHANTSSCYTFAGWTPNTSVANASAANTTVTMSQNRTLTANYTIKTYTLSLTANNSGGSPYFNGSSPFTCGTNASIYANTSAGYVFAGWSPTDGVANPSAGNTTVLMTQNRSLVACYAPISTTSWLAGYSYRKTITINHTDAGAQTNYQMMLTVSNANGVSSGSTVYLNGSALSWPNDVRFTKSDGTSLLDFWIEKNDSTSGTWWVEFDAIPAHPNDGSFYIYYGKASDTSASNGVNTFPYFDDASSNKSANYTKVNIYNSAFTSAIAYDATNKQYNLSHTSSDNELFKINTGVFGEGYAYTLTGQITTGANTSNSQFGWWVRYNGSARTSDKGYGVKASNSADKLGIDRENGGTSETNLASASVTINSLTWYKMVVYLYATNNIKAELYNASGTLLATANITDATYTGNSYKTAGLFFAYTNSITAAVKGIYIRNYASPQPTWGAWGNTEAD